MAAAKAASTEALICFAVATKSACMQSKPYLNTLTKGDPTKLTGAELINAASNAVVLALRLVKSCFTRAGIPPMGRAWKAGFLATIPESALRMVGSKPLTRLRIVVPSASETGLGALYIIQCIRTN